MAIATVGQKIMDIVDILKLELFDAIDQQRAYVQHVENSFFSPHEVDWSIPQQFARLSERINHLNTQLQKYCLFDAALQEYVDQVQDMSDSMSDRFLKWARRRTIGSAEAMQMFNRSRSTIYRWIRSGKLDAVKEHGRWVIVV